MTGKLTSDFGEVGQLNHDLFPVDDPVDPRGRLGLGRVGRPVGDRVSAKTRPQQSADPPHGLTEVNTLQLMLPNTDDPPAVLSE